jgi:small-conductance mechanosensitive channel
MQILKAAVDSQMGVLKQPDPFIRFTVWRFIIKFSIIFWSEELFRVENIKSEMRIKIFELFKTTITIPFPQRVVHINK